MSTHTYQEVLNYAQHLTPDDQLRLLEELARIIRQQGPSQPRRSILEFEGIGQEAWKGIDAQKFINQERDSWNG